MSNFARAVARGERPNRRNRPKPPESTITKARAAVLTRVVAASKSPMTSHAEFCDELEKARALGHGRQFRGMKWDGDTTTSARFYGIAARTAYQWRRGRRAHR